MVSDIEKSCINIAAEKKMQYLKNELTYEQYKILRESVGWYNFSEEQARNALENSIYVLSVMENDKTIAMARLIGDGMYYIIADVVVMPEFQKREIGSSLINKLLEYVQVNIPAGGRVSVQLIAEKGKEKFYQRFGFKKMPRENCGSGMRKVIYGRTEN